MTTSKRLPLVIPTVRFWNRDLNIPSPALVRLHEADSSRAFIVQAGNGAERCAIVWKVWLQRRGGNLDANISSTDLAKLDELTERHLAKPQAREKVSLVNPSAPTPEGSLPGSSSSSRASTTGSRERRTVVLGSRESTRKVAEVDEQRNSDDLFNVLNQTNPDVYISVLECHTIRHKEHDATCVSLSLDSGNGLLSRQQAKGIKHIYLGTSQGPVKRYDCPVLVKFGEEG